MRRNQLLAGIMTAMTVVMPVANVYADSAKNHEVQIATSIEEKKSDIDKAAVLQNSVKMTDRISAAADGKNIMFSPTSLNFALGMIAEGAKGETKKEIILSTNAYLGTDDFASYAKDYLDKIKEYNTEDENYGYKSKLKIADAVWADDELTLQEKFRNTVSDSFGAEVENVDFSAAEKTCGIILV